MTQALDTQAAVREFAGARNQNIVAFLNEADQVVRERGPVRTFVLCMYQYFKRITGLSEVVEVISQEAEKQRLDRVLQSLADGVDQTAARLDEVQKEALDLQRIRDRHERQTLDLEKRLHALEARVQAGQEQMLALVDHHLEAVAGLFPGGFQFDPATADRLGGWYRSWMPGSRLAPTGPTPDPAVAALLEAYPSRNPLGEEFLDRMLARVGLRLLRGTSGSAFLGEGRYSVVYRAYNESLPGRQVPREAPVAVKIAVDPEFLVEFREQAERDREILGRLAQRESPAVVRVFHSSTLSTFPVIVYELFEGSPLGDYVSERRPTEDQRLFIAWQVLEACRHAYEVGVLHGDLAPQNILVSDSRGGPIVKVIDYGLGRVLHTARVTDRRAQGGSRDYLAPEARSGSPAKTSDLYSVGCLLHLLLFPETTAPVLRGLMDRLLRPRPEDRGTPSQAMREVAGLLRDRPGFELGEIRSRAGAVRTYFNRLGGLLVEVERTAKRHRLATPEARRRVPSGQIDDGVGNPVSIDDQRRKIETEVLARFDRPYQIAFMGIFSSGKTMLINKLLIHMQGHALAPYSSRPDYLDQPNYRTQVQPYLRRSAAEPTDKVITILCYRGPLEDDAQQTEMRRLIADGQPLTGSDPVRLALPLEPLRDFNLIDTPGLNEDLTLNSRVGSFLQSCDLVVYTFAATNVMNIQDHYLVTRQEEVAPGKHVLYLVNQVDVLLDRLDCQCFWDEQHHPTVSEVGKPLKQRIESQVNLILREVAQRSGREPGPHRSLVEGDNFWLVSARYHYQIEELYAHLWQTIQRTAVLDRLRDTPAVLRTHLGWAAEFVRDYLRHELRPRVAVCQAVLGELGRSLGVDLPARIREEWQRWVRGFVREQGLEHRHYLESLRFEPSAEEPLPGEGFPASTRTTATWATRYDPEEEDQPALWGVEGRYSTEDFPVLKRLYESLAPTRDPDRVWAWLDQEILEKQEFGKLRGLLASALQKARKEGREQMGERVERALDEFAFTQLPTQVRGAQAARQGEIDQICADAEERLRAAYQSQLEITWGLTGSPEELAARALRTGTLTAYDPQWFLDQLKERRSALRRRMDQHVKELEETLQTRLAELSRERERLVASVREDIRKRAEEPVFTAEQLPGTAVPSGVSVMGKPLRQLVREAGHRERWRWRKGCLARLTNLVGCLAFAFLAVWLAVVWAPDWTIRGWLLAGGLLGPLAVGTWLHFRIQRRADAERGLESDFLAEAWQRLAEKFDADTRTRLRRARDELRSWTTGFYDYNQSVMQKSKALADEFEAVFTRDHLPDAIDQWVANLRRLQQERTVELDRYRKALLAAIDEYQEVLKHLSGGNELLNSVAFFHHLYQLHALLHQDAAPA